MSHTRTRMRDFSHMNRTSASFSSATDGAQVGAEPGYEHVIAYRVPATVIDQETGLFHSKMVVTEDTIACYCNGDDLLFVFDIPEEFKGSTLCGATIDMGASNNRYPNIEAIVSPITITTRAAAS